MAQPEESKNLLLAIRYSRGQLELLDQRKLPHESIYIDIPDAEAAWHAIKDMVVRGAPAIAIAAALSLAVEVVNRKKLFESPKEARDHINERLDYLVSSRPTAVNLSDAAGKLKKVVEKATVEESKPEGVVYAYVTAAEVMLADDVSANKAIGKFGAKAILEAVKDKKEGKVKVLTHCNTGSLATAAYGTALGVIRTLFYNGDLEGAICTETRPYNQGSRLTAYELVHDRIPATLIADSAAASLQHLGGVDAVVVGADRIAANGDTANKIGTYSLSLSAFHHGIPFFIAAPLTSVDLLIRNGTEIEIEQRHHKEVTHSLGGHGPQVAPSGINVWNPSFDVTPAKFITGIITDKGVITKLPTKDEFDIPAFLESLKETEKESQKETETPGFIQKFEEKIADLIPNLSHKKDVEEKEKLEREKEEKEAVLAKRGFKALNPENVSEYLSNFPEIVEKLGGNKLTWKVREVGDGNLNFVYIVEGTTGSLVLKQALPYIRCVGESWPMTLERAFFEASILKEHGRLVVNHTPQVFLFDHPMAIIAMEYLGPPHIILRKGLIKGTEYPLLAEHVSTYMANTFFFTSLLFLSTEEHKAAVAKYCANVEMCRLTEQVIFTDPYRIAETNRWTSPQLDKEAEQIRTDVELKLAVASLKTKFCEKTQALIHGDLHTGSIMVTEKSTYVIDPEFGFYGPMGFDLGAFFGNLFLAFFSQNGHSKSEGDCKDYESWILKTVVETWELFSVKLISLWEENAEKMGDAYPSSVFNSANIRHLAQENLLGELFVDTMGFAAAKMIRRIVGIAHVEDLESIENVDIRADCEKKALNFAFKVLKEGEKYYPTMEAIVADLRSISS